MDTTSRIAGAQAGILDEEEIFNQARRIGATEERLAFVARACGDDQRLMQRVKGLLRVEQGATRFLDTPAGGLTAISGLVALDLPETETQIGPYRLLEPIGQGGFGVVFRAMQQAPVRRTVALKLIRAGMNSDEVVARFEAERQALALMDHASIARVLDGGQTASGRPWFVMELVEGAGLCAFADSRRLPLRERLELFTEICDAVAHAHQKGIIHRDLKPSNILVTERDGAPAVKVIDFGIAKAIGVQLTDRPAVTQSMQLVGTPAYMSPEQVASGAIDIDTRADIYSLGVILYELLTGTTPVADGATPGEGLPELVERIRTAEPVRPSQFWGRTTLAIEQSAGSRRAGAAGLARYCRNEIDWIALKCLEKDRERRYPTAIALRDDVDRFLAGNPVEAGPPSTTYRLRKLLHKHRGWVAAAAAMAGLLVAATAVSLWLADRAWRAERQAVADRGTARAALVQAQNEAAIATAINQFLLTDLLGQSDPARQSAGAPRNPDITVRELLDRAAERIGGRFAGQPRTEASVRMTLGQSFAGLGLYRAADEHYRRARELLEREEGLDHPDTWACLQLLAWNCRALARHDEACELLELVLGRQRRQPGFDERELMKTVNMLGGVLHAAGQRDRARETLELAWTRRRSLLGNGHPETIETLGNLATVNFESGRLETAAEQLRQVLSFRRQRQGNDHPATIRGMRGLATVLATMGQLDEAHPLMEEARTLAEKVFEPDHPDRLDLANDLAVLLEMEGDLEEAEELYRETLEGRARRLGPNHRQTRAARDNLVTLYRESGRHAEAEGLLRGLVEQNRQSLGDEHADTVRSIGELEAFLRQSGRAADAASGGE